MDSVRGVAPVNHFFRHAPARLIEIDLDKNPQLQSADRRRIGHSRLSRSTHNSRERISLAPVL